jgi:ParB family chromosome partitioning protein
MTEALVKSELAKLAKEINEAHAEVEASFGHSLKHAIRAGDLLNEAKTKCPHGAWEPWLEKSIRFSRSQAHVYRQVAENKELLLANIRKTGHFTIEAALRILKGGLPMLQSMSNNYWTPRQYMDAVHAVMGGIDLDPASCAEANKTVRAELFYGEEDDGLLQPWSGRVFLNPPYGKLGSAFAERLYEFLGSGVNEAIMLVNSRATDADWFQPCFSGVLCFTDHRIDFDSPDEKPTSSTHGSVFVYFGPNEERFAEVFAQFGNVVKRWP